MKRSFLALAIVISFAAAAQGVYKTPGANGPVYSDKPQPGAEEVKLRPLSVVPPPPRAAAVETPASRPDPARVDVAPSAYRQFAITQPQDNGSVGINGGPVEVRLSVDPPLLLGEQHAFSVAINGVVAAQRFTATEFTIPPEFWNGTLPGEQTMQIDAMIVDGRGQIVKRAAPVRFYLRQVNVFNAPAHRPPPKPRPRPVPPKNEPEPMRGAVHR